MHVQNGTTMSETDNNKNNEAVVARLTGRVKWFNNKTGFGFITALTDSEGVREGSDVFVHHSAIKVSQEQYRYLVQGEYVEFVLSKLKDSAAAEAPKHEFQAVDVSGVKGGKLICETRWESRSSSGFSSSPARFKRSEEPREWTTVAKKTGFVPRQGTGEWRRGEGSSTRGGRGGKDSSE